VDDKRRELRALEEKATEIETAIGVLDESVAAEQRFGKRSRETFSTYGGFAQAALEKRAKLFDALAEANAAVEVARDELLELFAEAKRYEVGLEQQQARERHALELREQQAIDEAALNQHRRKDPV
jgi:flagellar export protein FliJ